jgi:predicted ATP-grasp superfamily ATP-dependent carboligase
MIISFSGWNDAGEAATGAISHLFSLKDPGSSSSKDPDLIADFDSEEFYDFQVNRPIVSIDEDGARSLAWPSTAIFALPMPHLEFDFVVVEGVEPSMKWKKFTYELLDLADDLEVEMVITLGSMLADVPHTRPIVVGTSSANPKINTRFGLEPSKYEGPTGVLGVIQDHCLRRGVDALSLWAAVPHYASNSPSPKASLALINALEDLLSINLPQGQLPQLAMQWQNEIDELAQEDSEVSDYVKALEESKDASELSDTSGEVLAREAERYLRRQMDQEP